MRLFVILALCCLVVIAAGQGVPACNLQRKMVKQSGDKSAFLPRCNKDGTYQQIQCRQGFCWCAKKDGTQLTKSKQGKPDCSGQPY